MRNIAINVSREYLKLKKLNKKDGLLKYLEKVGYNGTFIWSDKKERLNGNRIERWVLFYERFSEEDRNGLSREQKGSSLPELLESYYNALRNRVKELEKIN